MPADIGDPAQTSAMFNTIHERLGCPEVLLYNAGSGAFGTVVDITAEQYEKDWRVKRWARSYPRRKSRRT